MAKPNSKLGDNKLLEDAVHEICTKARSKGVRLMVDAEHQGLQDGVDSWTMVSTMISSDPSNAF